MKHRKDALAALMKPFGPVALLDEKDSRALWRSVRRRSPSPATRRARGRSGASRPRPARGHEIAAAITPAAQMFYDWAGGLLWVAMPFADEPDAGCHPRRGRSVGGHATLVRAPAAVRASVEVFEPQDVGIARLE